MEEQKGALPIQTLKELIRTGKIRYADPKNTQPASMDLSVGHEIFRLCSVFMPRPEEKVEDLLEMVGAELYSFHYPLEVGVPYLVKLREELELPEHIYGYTSSKSTSGRIDVCVNLLADHIARFDSVGVRGYRGKLWAIVKPKSFPVKIAPGETIIQLRLFTDDTRMNEKELEVFYEKEQPVWDKDGKPVDYRQMNISDRDGGLIFTVDLRDEIVGWRCEPHQGVLDLSKRNFYEPEKFFKPIPRPKNGILSLRKGDFYIFYTRQWIRVPPMYAAEMVPVDIRNGEYRSHYAGFFDPGFGYSRDGSMNGRPGVLEVRPYEDNLILRDDQPICKFIFERVTETPDEIYGETGSHYHKQIGPRLSKHFKVG